MWHVIKPGIVDFRTTYDMQLKLVNQKQEGDKNNYFILCEHFPVFTKGKSSKEINILDKNIPAIAMDRGGDLTFHEPGQLIGYIITDLKTQKLTIKEYVSNIETLIILVLKKLNIDAYTSSQGIGVWTKNKKIASIGIGVKKRITLHGFALNINNSLEGFSKINPCGFNADIMTSVYKQTGKVYEMSEIIRLFEQEITEVFN